MTVAGELGAWPIVLLGIAATFFWRALGGVFSARINPDSAVFQWVSCVSYAMVAGLIARMIIMPLGVLAETPLSDRLAATAFAFAVFFLWRKQVLPGVLGGVAAFVLLGLARESGWLG